MKYNLLDQHQNKVLVRVSKEDVIQYLGITLSYFYESLSKGTRIKNQYKIERYDGE